MACGRMFKTLMFHFFASFSGTVHADKSIHRADKSKVFGNGDFSGNWYLDAAMICLKNSFVTKGAFRQDFHRSLSVDPCVGHPLQILNLWPVVKFFVHVHRCLFEKGHGRWQGNFQASVFHKKTMFLDRWYWSAPFLETVRIGRAHSTASMLPIEMENKNKGVLLFWKNELRFEDPSRILQWIKTFSKYWVPFPEISKHSISAVGKYSLNISGKFAQCPCSRASPRKKSNAWKSPWTAAGCLFFMVRVPKSQRQILTLHAFFRLRSDQRSPDLVVRIKKIKQSIVPTKDALQTVGLHRD